MALQFLPYALAAIGGYQGYRQARDSGASGLGRLIGAGIGAYGGYNLGQVGGFASKAGFGNRAMQSFVPSFTQTGIGSALASRLGLAMAPQAAAVPVAPGSDRFLAAQKAGSLPTGQPVEGRSLSDLLLRREVKGEMEYDPVKLAALAGGIPYAMGAFDQAPVDIYMPGYNVNYLTMRDKRPGYSYIDPTDGKEKEYEQVYAPEKAGEDSERFGPYSMVRQRLKTGGLAEIKKFNEGGINYLPSKTSHDENDATNYVRASGYVEDGSGVGDKDEDTMLAQLADGEFVTRADGVLGAGIIAGANPNSIKDMREKGAQYFYEQQKRYKRIFDLIEDRNGNIKQKTN